MSPAHAVLLGLLQGLTEFLPVSSSGHLVIVPALLHWPTPGLVFTVVVHVGTLLAVIVYYWRDWRQFLSGTFRWLARGCPRPLPPQPRLLLWLLAATLPAALVGVALAGPIERMFNDIALVAGALLVTGLILLVAHARGTGQIGETKMSLGQALVIGCAQAVAVVPGLSRSGLTIGAGLMVGLERNWAARFAFLLSVPVIAGAGLKEGIDLIAAKPNAAEGLVLALGMLASALSGLVAIYLVVRVVQSKRFWWFGVYCLGAGAAVLIARATGYIG